MADINKYMHIVTSFHRAQYGKGEVGKINFPIEKPG